MITGLANLGPSLRGNSGLGEKTPGLSKNQASEFDQILNQESDKEVRTSNASKDPVPVEKGLQKLKPDKVDKEVVSSSANEPRMAQKENTGREESGSVKAKKVGEKVGKKSEDSSQTREQVMLQFMDSMESEFNIPPARIAEAMTNLSEGELEASPEASASQVITQLDLPSDQEQKAYALYMGMLAQLKQVEQPSLKTSDVMTSAGMTGSGLAAVLSQKEKRDQLNNSLDQLSQKFFMKTPPAPAPNPMAPAQAETLPVENSLPELAPRTMDVQSYNVKDLNISNMNLPKNQMSMPEKSYEELSSEASTLKNDILAEMQKVDPQSPEAEKLAKALATLGAATSALDQAQADSAPNPQTALTGFAAAMKKEDLDLGNSSDKGGQSTGEGNSFFSQNLASSGSHSAKADVSSTLAAPTFAGAMGAMDQGAGAQDNQANIQQIMKQAQYMIKKGGGESKIQLNPEGLGEIRMKVLVNDGKVNLEMTTENKETKKLLESSINELKSHLSQHKLSVDQVRVDVGTQTANDQRQNDSQNLQRQMDMRQEQSQNQQRDQARDFWSQFQDGAFERRASFFDSPGIRAYGGSRRTEPLAPGSSSGVSEKRYSGSGKGRGIDLVA